MVAYQREQLARLLNHANAFVPFYKNRLNWVIRNDGSVNWNRWRDIPIVTRKDLLEKHKSMQATQMLPAYGAIGKFSSSGTTGTPVKTTHNAYASWVNRAAVMRSYQWHKIDFNKNLCELYLMKNPQEAAYPEGKLIGSWGPAWDHHQTGKFWQLERTTPLDLYFKFLMDRRISYIAMRPKPAQTVALAAQKFGIKLKLDGVITVGANVGLDDRKACMEAFGAKMMASYNSKEGHKMATQCPMGNHYHMMSECSLLEILDNNNEPCRPGEVGRVVVTPFFSFAQPLIRYEQGDLVERGEPCKCGRTLPVINRIVGRSAHMFRFPNGMKIAPMLPIPCREALGATIWQVAQTAPLTIEIRYCSGQEATEAAKAYVTEQIPKNMYANVEVVFKKWDIIPSDDKFNEYVCELPDEVP